MPLQQNLRLHYLDAVRSFALLLGILFHTALSFMPFFIGWAVMDVSTSDRVPRFVLVSHSFRMALFFLIAGYFNHLTMGKKGIKPFIRSRLIRVGLPFLFGWFVLKPLVVSGWIIGAESMRGEVNIINGLKAGFASLSELPEGFLTGTHLWFLYYLLIISFSVVVVRWLISFHVPTKYLIECIADQVISTISQSTLMLLVVALPTAIGLWFMQHWGLDTPDKTLMPHIPILTVYGGFFLMGWMLQRDPALIGRFSHVSLGKLLLCVVSIFGSIYLSGFQGNFGHSQYNLLKMGFMLSYSVMMWSLISLSIGFSKKCFHRPNKLIQYVADASYWLYLVHLPIVIWLQITFAELPLHWAIKLISIFGITIGISLLLYDLMVRATFIGAVLNGRRKPRMLFR